VLHPTRLLTVIVVAPEVIAPSRFVVSSVKISTFFNFSGEASSTTAEAAGKETLSTVPVNILILSLGCCPPSKLI